MNEGDGPVVTYTELLFPRRRFVKAANQSHARKLNVWCWQVMEEVCEAEGEEVGKEGKP